ncbi:hypothetical protein TYRP_014237 [Tyrophagus putrescentiae]|nr:hypothetical protein TYRP_014237 [Tyrophagus putrescentiae]
MKFFTGFLFISALAAIATAQTGGFGPNDGQYKDTSGGPREKIQAAIQTKHTVEMKSVDIPYEDLEPQIIEVEGGAIPLEIHFKSSSSRIRVHQTHQAGGAGEVEQTSSEEEPHRLIHEVKKPIIQEEIQPVQEEIHTIVAKGEARRNFDRSQSKAGGGGGGGSGGMVPPAGSAAPPGVPKSPARRAAGANVDKPLY